MMCVCMLTCAPRRPTTIAKASIPIILYVFFIRFFVLPPHVGPFDRRPFVYNYSNIFFQDLSTCVYIICDIYI